MTGRGRSVAWLLVGVLLVAGCGGAGSSSSASSVDVAQASDGLSGTIAVAYPDVPVTWSGLEPRDTAAIDLFALWGLPLFRVDHAGQLRPGLGTAIELPVVADGWAVEVPLAEGEWSDGRPVTAEDVVATVEALGASSRGWPEGLAVEAIEDRRVRFSADEPVGGWAWLLAGAPGVLPAHVLEDGGLDAFAGPPRVVGGWFTVDDASDPRRRLAFVAHQGSALGAPVAAEVTVDIVPSYESSLGLLDRGEVDLVLGHLALNAPTRGLELDGVQAAAPLGGTWVGLDWIAAGALAESPDGRRDVVGSIDLGELVEGLLAEQGAPASSPVPGIDGPWRTSLGGEEDARDITRQEELVLLVPRWHEALAFTARVVQANIRGAGGQTALIGHESPVVLDPPEPVDVAIRPYRSLPRPVGQGLGDELLVAPGPSDVVAGELAEVFDGLLAEERATPLYRIGVAHAWREGLGPVRPSSWPGLALWDVGTWQPVR